MKITLGNTLPPYPAFVGCTPSDTDKTLPRISFLFIFVLCFLPMQGKTENWIIMK